MAYDFVPASSHMIDWGNFATLDARSYSLCMWAYPEAAATGYLSGKTDGSNGFYWRRLVSDHTAWDAGHNATSSLTSATATCTVNTWQHMALTFTTGTLTMDMYKNASSIATNTVAAMTATSAVFAVGNRAALDRDWDGRIAEVAVWLDYVLTADDLAALAGAYSPWFIRPRPNLYAPMIRGETDVRGVAATNTNAAAVIEHPRMIYPSTGYFNGKGTATATGRRRMLLGVGI